MANEIRFSRNDFCVMKMNTFPETIKVHIINKRKYWLISPFTIKDLKENCERF